MGDVPPAKDASEEVWATQSNSNKKLGYGLIGLLVVFLIVLQSTGTIDMTTAQGLAQGAGVIIVSISASYFLYILIAGGLTRVEQYRVEVLIILFLAIALFWAGYEQAGTSLQIFAERHTERMIGGWGSAVQLVPEFPAYIRTYFCASAGQSLDAAFFAKPQSFHSRQVCHGFDIARSELLRYGRGLEYRGERRRGSWLRRFSSHLPTSCTRLESFA